MQKEREFLSFSSSLPLRAVSAGSPHRHKFSKDDLDVEIEENFLKIIVKAHQDKEVSENDYIIREISRGQMTRILSLGEDIDVDSAKTSFKDGILHIEFNAKEIEEESKIKKLVIE